MATASRGDAASCDWMEGRGTPPPRPHLCRVEMLHPVTGWRDEGPPPLASPVQSAASISEPLQAGGMESLACGWRATGYITVL